MRAAWAPAALFAAGLVFGSGGVAAWAVVERPQPAGEESDGESLKGRHMVSQPKRPVTVADVIGVEAPTGAAAIAGFEDAEAHKILARTLRREGKFEAAAVAAARYRSVRLGDVP